MFTKFKLLFALLFVSFFATAQQPILTVNDKDSGKVSLQKLAVDVRIVANIAITTMEMEFCNSSKRILEGELTFPLPDGVSINRFALDINGKMREAVPVEREKGQIAFENTIRKKIDPALLEKTSGNSFRTRIYPLPAQGCRKIIIGYQQTLFANYSNLLTYSLPLSAKKAIPQFSVNLNVYSKNEPEIGKSCNTKIAFAQLNNVYNAKFSENNFKPKGSFEISIPKLTEGEEIIMQQKNGTYYFLINHFPQVKSTEQTLPNNIHIIWDNSFSGLFRNHKKEIEFIKAYAAKIKNGTISLATLNIGASAAKSYEVSNGACPDLISAIENIVYDGATNLNLITPSANAASNFLFSDGLNTWQNDLVNTDFKKSISTITAGATANFGVLKHIAATNRGQFLNLNNLSVHKAIELLQKQPLSLINVQTDPTISQVYPSYGVVNGNMVVTGISSAPKAKLILEYGYGDKVLLTEECELDYEAQQNNFIGIDTIWAQQKIIQLSQRYDLFKPQIEALSKQYNIVTDNTSLIVLDDVEDYVKYDIPPPTELRAAFDSIKKAQDIMRQEIEANMLHSAIQASADLKNWWLKDYSPKITINVSEEITGNKITSVNIHFNGKNYGINQRQLIINTTDSGYAYISANNYIAKKIFVRPYESYNVVLQLKRKIVNGKKEEPTILRVPDWHRDPSGTVLKDSLVFGSDLEGTYSISNENDAIVVGYATKQKNMTGAVPALKAQLMTQNNEWAGSTNFAVANTGTVYMFTAPKNSLAADVQTNGEQKQAGSFNVKAINSDKPFIKALEKTPAADRYKKYLELRKDFLQTASFYFDVAQFFYQQGDKATALLVLSTVADLGLDDHETYKMLGYLLRQFEQYEEAKYVFGKVLQWRKQEPQSYRDYALALLDVGKTQHALDTLYTALTKNFNIENNDAYSGIEEVLVMELNQILAAHPTLDKSKIDTALLASLPVDIRVTLNWNMNDSDMDLWVIDPRGEKVYYGHKESLIGGRIGDDFTGGYGPEQFLLRKAIKGKYKVLLHYFGDDIQKMAGGTAVQAEIFTNYGTPLQKRHFVTLQLEKGKDAEGLLVGEFEF